jgi:hypothetical protein
MKIFRVHLTDDSGMSLGFEYYTNKKDAFAAFKRNQQDEEIRYDGNDHIEERDFVIGKYEVIKLLNEWASHADNG